MDDKTTAQPDNKKFASEYRGLGRLLHAVRWTQHLLAIIAEALILLSFAMSGMDVSLGGVLASISLFKVLWAAMFALGIDTAFALSWVRVRQCVSNRQWWPLAGNMLLALSMSFIIFQPIAIQLIQQTLNVSFETAVTSLGINIVLLTYARSAVAIFLGAILAMTNVEHPATASIQPTTVRPQGRLLWFVKMPQQSGPAIHNETSPDNEQTVNNDGAPAAQVTVSEEQSAPELATGAQADISTATTPEQRAQKVSEIDVTGLSARERVAKVLELFPDLSDRELGKLSGMSAATAKKHKEAMQYAQSVERAHSNEAGGHA
jgi:hypothetical protein